jgi:NAD(P)-dependent dehydrogenase (short-subunit alcohol dehydrogenase family)
MIERGAPGRIVNVGSVNSFAAEAEAGAYVATKGAVLLLTKAMAVDLAPFGITVNCLAPGPTLHEHTAGAFTADPLRATLARRIPLGRPAAVDEVAAAAVFLASDESRFVTGTSLVVDGGLLAALALEPGGRNGDRAEA